MTRSQLRNITNLVKEQSEGSYYKRPWIGYRNFDTEFSVKEKDKFFTKILQDLRYLAEAGYPVFCTKNKRDVYNIPCSFDIETSSFYEYGKKRAIMYIWQFGFNGLTIYGRTWDDFFFFIEELVEVLGLSDKRLIYIYVHNLSYEFQFIRKYFEWDKVFALKKRKVLYAAFYPMGLEFRCSYLLANASLAHVGDPEHGMLTRYKVSKMVGDLDYSLIRNSATPISPKELKYCLNDVRVVMAYIQEKIEQDGGITNIQLTNTGYVRAYCRNACMPNKHESQKFHAFMNSLRIDNEAEYDQNKRAFMGGFTHTGVKHANRISRDVGSADLISSYPAEIASSYFPMSSARLISKVTSVEVFKQYLETYCCIFDIKFYNLLPKVDFENYLSISRCVCEGATINNGRIVSAKTCVTTLTELDFDIVGKMYNWDSMEVTNLRVYNRGYLPKTLIEAVLDFYCSKNKLKDVPEEVVEYLRSKNMVNATFGMMVTDIVRPEVILEDDKWLEAEAYKAKQLESYNKNFNRFLYYTWGIYVTAHARHNLFEAILEFGDDYIYADTDSIKGINFEKHLSFFELYNFKNKIRMERMCRIMDIPFDRVCPETIKGEKKLLGNWEIEKSYALFKAAGAKRYMYQYPDGKFSLTVSGLNKNFAVPYLLSHYPSVESIMEHFQDGFWVPAGYTGKQTLTYIDEETEGEVEDYLGNVAPYHELSSVHMEAQGFIMSQAEDYLRLIEGVRESELR